MLAATTLFVLVACSTATLAQGCPTSPSYSPDFTSNQACLTPNGSASFPAPTAGVSTITAWSGTGGIVTFTASNSFTAGQPITLSGFVNSTFFNGLAFPVLAAGLSSNQFEIAFSGYSGSSDTGTATPLNALQLTPDSTYNAGSAWYAPQSIASGFSTTFTFQVTNPTPGYGSAADGIAFLIQNSTAGTLALGPDGCGMGFADGSCTSSTGGIPNSLAVDFKTYNDGYPVPNNNSVSVVSYGTGANCIDQACNIAYNNSLPNNIVMADGNIHTVTISYTLQPTLSTSPNCFTNSTPEPCLDVILDGYDLFAGGVQLILNGTTAPLSLETLIGGGSNAWVGFTGATGAVDDYQDILSWTFSPLAQSQTASVSPTTPAVYGYNGGCGDNGSGCTGTGYNVNVQENPGSSLTIQNMVVTPIPIVAASGNPGDSQTLCNSIVDALNPNTSTSPFVDPNATPPQTAQCFVYTNGGGPGVDAPVMLAVTCPPSGVCDTTENQFFAALASYFSFTCTENPPLIAPTCTPGSPSSFGNFANLTSTTGYPSIAFLEGAGPDPNNPCTPATGTGALPLFQTNQVVSYILGDTSSKPVKGGSGLLTSCWVATYNTPGEMPTATVTSINGSSPTNGATYQQGSTVTADYTCAAVDTDPNHISILDPSGYPAAGPYLTVGACAATSGLTPTTSSCTPVYPPGPLDSCSSTLNLDTSTPGAYTLTVDVQDSAMNTAAQQWTYNVVGNQAALTLIATSPLTYNQSETLNVSGGSTAGTVNYNLVSGPCTVTANQLMANSGTGSCTLTATMAGNNDYNSVTSGPITVTLGLANQAALTLIATSPLTYNQSETLSVSGGSTAGTVNYNLVSGPCTVTANQLMANSGTGSCTLTATMAGNSNYNSVTSAPTTVSLGLANQAALTLIAKSPLIYNQTETLSVSGGTTAGTVNYTLLSGPCTLSGNSLTANSSSGTCTLTATMAGNSNYNSVTSAVAAVTLAAPPAWTVTPTPYAFPTSSVGQSRSNTFTVTNPSGGAKTSITVSIPGSGNEGGSTPGEVDPDDYVITNNGCRGASLAGGQSCNVTVTWTPDGDDLKLGGGSLAYLQVASGKTVLAYATMTATTIDPTVNLSPTSYAFTSTSKTTQLVSTLTNPSTQPTELILVLLYISSGGNNFTLAGGTNSCTDFSTLQPNASCNIYVTFTPPRSGTVSGQVTILSNAANASLTVSLSGKQ